MRVSIWQALEAYSAQNGSLNDNTVLSSVAKSLKIWRVVSLRLLLLDSVYPRCHLSELKTMCQRNQLEYMTYRLGLTDVCRLVWLSNLVTFTVFVLQTMTSQIFGDQNSAIFDI